MAERIDPEMLKNLDLLLNFDIAEAESDWTLVEQLAEVEDNAKPSPEGQGREDSEELDHEAP